ncbi:Mss4p nuclear export [Lobulomyces angularis]|nr:Mss4p nuclear export [Lobulomyces angularis]
MEIDVNFDFFDFKEVDFLGLKTLLKQSFSADHTLFNLSEISDLIIKQSNVGCTVKADDSTDPYAFISVINLNLHSSNESINQIKDYFLEKTRRNINMHKKLIELFDRKIDTNSNNPCVGLIFNERFINMPPQIFPQMLKMTLEEIEWAVEEGEKFNFDYYLVPAKIYEEVESKIDNEGNLIVMEETEPKKKKNKQSNTTTLYFQPEDEIFQEYCEIKCDFKFSNPNQESDSKRTFQDFGIEPSRRLLLIKSENLKKVLADVEMKF